MLTDLYAYCISEIDFKPVLVLRVNFLDICFRLGLFKEWTVGISECFYRKEHASALDITSTKSPGCVPSWSPETAASRFCATFTGPWWVFPRFLWSGSMFNKVTVDGGIQFQGKAASGDAIYVALHLRFSCF